MKRTPEQRYDSKRHRCGNTECFLPAGNGGRFTPKTTFERLGIVVTAVRASAGFLINPFTAHPFGSQASVLNGP
jgi:hypothetical protein